MLQVAGVKDELLGPACPWLQIGSIHGSGVGYFKLQPGGSQTDAPVDQTGVQVSSLPQTDFPQLLEVDQMTGRALAVQGQATFRPGAEGLLGETQAAPLKQAHHAAFSSPSHAQSASVPCRAASSVALHQASQDDMQLHHRALC